MKTPIGFKPSWPKQIIQSKLEYKKPNPIESRDLIVIPPGPVISINEEKDD